MAQEILIDGFSIFVDDVDSFGPHGTKDKPSRGVLAWSSEKLGEALKPAVLMLKSFRDVAQNMAPDKMEASIQFDLALKGETPVLKIASAETKAQIAVKFIWDKE